jgi:hypothetical protein
MAQFEVRPCLRQDLPAVVDLLLTGGEAAPGVSREQIRAYCEQIYFDSPWADADIPSLVTVDGDGRLEGFVGVMPRPMRLGDADVTAAVPGNFVVRAGPDGKVNAFAALAMLKRLFGGPQDVTFTDTANEASRRLWEASGAVNPSTYSLDWFRPIKPATAVLQMMETARGMALPLSRLVMAGAGAADLVGAPILARMARNKAAACTAAPLSREALLALLNGRDRHQMAGRYTAEDLAWILEGLATKAQGHNLRQAEVLDDQGARAGAYVYLLHPRGMAQVLAAAAREGRFDLVLQAMVSDAAEQGASVLHGQVQPRQAAAYKGQRCFLMCNQWTLVHSRRPEVLDTFHRGGVRLTALDGERWTRFSDLFAI